MTLLWEEVWYNGGQSSSNVGEALGVQEVFDSLETETGFLNTLRKMTGRQPKLNPARTFPAAKPLLRLDRIYVRGFEVVSAEVLHGIRWSRLSDHAPIVATLELKKRRNKKT